MLFSAKKLFSERSRPNLTDANIIVKIFAGVLFLTAYFWSGGTWLP
jgi:hypothetical protein